MNQPHPPLSPRQTLLWILVPMLATFAFERLFLHAVGVQHVHLAGHLVHHLFFGVLLTIPAAFVLAFGVHSRVVARAARAALGIGSALVLDEIIYLVATQASDGDYVSPLSVWGGVVFMALGVGLLLGLYGWHRERTRRG